MLDCRDLLLYLGASTAKAHHVIQLRVVVAFCRQMCLWHAALSRNLHI